MPEKTGRSTKGDESSKAKRKGSWRSKVPGMFKGPLDGACNLSRVPLPWIGTHRAIGTYSSVDEPVRLERPACPPRLNSILTACVS